MDQLNQLPLKLQTRLAQLHTIVAEPVMDDFDAGKRAEAFEEIAFLEEVLRTYGKSEEGKGNTSS
ncbi:MAG: hypothetical protein ACK5DE_02065 [Bacteroidota bacterium]|jgi:hypothetical protein